MDIFTQVKHFIDYQMFKTVFTFVRPLIVSCIVLVISNYVQCLLELSVESKNRRSSDDIIAHTMNKLFKILKLKEEDNSRAKEYSDLHKYFISSLQLYENNLKYINRLLIELNKGNITATVVPLNDFIKEIYNKLEDDKILRNDDEYVIKYIDNFLSNIQNFKEKYNVQNDNEDLNNEILNFLMQDYEETRNFTKSYESDISDENDFWEQSGRRIFKGERSKIKYFPFMASIQIFNNFHCAGSIIKSDLIITASSCLQLAWNNRFFRENPAFLSARVGSSFYNSGGEVIPVLEAYFHPEYDPKTLNHNVCVLRLIRHLKFRRKGKRIKRIDFDRNEHTLPVNTQGITVVGWGAKSHSPVIGNPWENIISYSILDIYPLRDCQDIYLKDYVTKKHFCAGFISRGGGACNRDVGGPGIVSGKLMGVISFGSPVCGMPDAPTVFTKLGYYSDWIEQIMEQEVPVSKKKTTLKPYRDSYQPPVPTLQTETTTFKIEPITGKTMTPIPIAQIDRQLRIDDGDLKNFLKILFNSKEIEEYKNILEVNNKTMDVYQDYTEMGAVTENNEYVTHVYEVPEENEKIDKLSSEKYDIDKYSEYNTTNNISEEDDSHDKILKLIDNSNLDRIVQEEIDKTNVSPKVLPKNESVLTLLYMTDDEKNDNTDFNTKENAQSEDNANEGISIALDHFVDLTRSKKNDYVLPENEIYGLLSEMIGEEVQKLKMDAF